MSWRTYIGIDGGLDGGLCAMTGPSSLIAVPMPTVKLGKGREIDVIALRDFLMDHIGFQDSAPPTVILEAASKHSPGVLALCSTWHSYGSIKTVLNLFRYRYHVVEPRTWQRDFWTRPKMAQGAKFDTKAAALLAASRMWPEQAWTASARCSKAHDGMVDAALLAEYGRRKSL